MVELCPYDDGRGLPQKGGTVADRAQTTSDPKTIASMRRAADAWTRQAERIEEADLRRLAARDPIKRPVNSAKPRNAYPLDPAHVGNVFAGAFTSATIPDNSGRRLVFIEAEANKLMSSM